MSADTAGSRRGTSGRFSTASLQRADRGTRECKVSATTPGCFPAATSRAVSRESRLGNVSVLLLAFSFGAFAQPPQRVPVDPAEVVTVATEIAQRSERMKSLFAEVHPADWVANGAPGAYIGQWNSLTEQNAAIAVEMKSIAEHPDGLQDSAQQRASLQEVLTTLFRLHRFDSDMDGLLRAVRRYQGSSVADSIESAAVGSQHAIERLQDFALDLASEKDRQLQVVDNEAQRCRATLANQPVVRPATRGKTTTPK